MGFPGGTDTGQKGSEDVVSYLLLTDHLLLELAFYEYIAVKSTIQMTTSTMSEFKSILSSRLLTAWIYLTNIKESVDATDTVFKHEAKCE